MCALGTAMIWRPPEEPGAFRKQMELPDAWLRHYNKILTRVVKNMDEKPVTCVAKVINELKIELFYEYI